MIRPILDWFRGRKDDGPLPTDAAVVGPEGSFDTQVLVQGGLADLKRVTKLLEQQSIDSQIIVPPSGCNT